MSKFKVTILLLVLFLTFIPQNTILAEDETPQYPVYIVQEGDSLGQIAVRFGVSVTELIDINHITDPNDIVAGSELLIPGLTGFSGRLLTKTITLGDTLESLSLRYQTTTAEIAKINRITSPGELFIGSSLILMEDQDTPLLTPEATLQKNQSVLALSLVNQTNPWLAILQNQKDSSSDIIPGTIFYQKAENQESDTARLSPEIESITLNPEILYQGHMATLRVTAKQEAVISGTLGSYTLHFYKDTDGTYVAYQGIHAQESPGLLNLELTSTINDKLVYRLDQMVMIKPGGYNSETLVVDPVTIEKDVNEQENNLILDLVSNPTPDKKWSIPVACPLEPPICIKSWFGTRRTYNDGAYSSFHGGLDLGVCSNLNILAAAPGKVIYTGNLVVRGNAILIDHGWGIVTGYYHLESFNVSIGDEVETGQLIGIMGATGRVTGTHLHFEVWVNGVLVDPQDWLDPLCQ